MSDPVEERLRREFQADGLTEAQISTVLRARRRRMRRALLPAPDADPLRTCGRCKLTMPLDEFKRNASKPGGRDYTCKACHADSARTRLAMDPDARARQAEASRRWGASNQEGQRQRAAAQLRRYRVRSDEERATDRARLRPGGLKRCRRCRQELPFEEFHVSRACADGLHSTCKQCGAIKPYLAALPVWEDRDTWSCVYCGGPFEHVDHVHPVSRGGTDDPMNLVPACATCNYKKHARHVLDFIAAEFPDLVAVIARLPMRVEYGPPSGPYE